MRRGALYSGVLHLVVIIIIIVGLPWWEEPLVVDQPIPIDVVTMADVTTPPKGKVSPEPPKPAPPKPEVSEPIPPAPTPPTPEPTPEPPKPVVQTPTPPAPAPEPVQETKAEPAPPQPEVQPTPPEPVPETPKPQAAPKPAPKPPPPVEAKAQPDKTKPDQKATNSDFLSVLKTVEKLKTQTAKADVKAPDQPQPSLEQTTTALSDQPLTMSEIDAIRQQIERCWNVPAGARDAENLVVDVKVELNTDGSVMSADIVDKGKLADPFYRAAAESARRAVMLCSPFQVPAKKYATWHFITLSFNPKEMFGT